MMHVKIAEAVTREHAERFAQAWLQWTTDALAMCDVFGAAEVMEWPDSEEFTPEQERYQSIRQEIVETTLRIARPAMADAFLAAAIVILARERER
jgi:hypothetical protein